MGLRGKFGETHAYKRIRGKMNMVALPGSPDVLNASQKARQERFIRAANYARAQMTDPQMKAEYATGVTRKKSTAFVVALTDSLNAPEVTEIKTSDYLGKVGDEIRVVATDDFRVVRLRVIIKSADGTELERGEAVQDVKNSDTWHYSATVANPSVAGTIVSATAFDIPDNETTLEKVL